MALGTGPDVHGRYGRSRRSSVGKRFLHGRRGVPTVAVRCVLAILAAAACGSDLPPPTTVTERDSVGVTIIENAVDTAALRVGWSIDPEPLLTIGGVDADESRQLFEVSGGVILSDGRLAVANNGSSQIRIYGKDGALLAAYGRKGEGPGEFGGVALAGVIGDDSLVAFDSQLRRVSIIDADTGFVRVYSIGVEGGGYAIARGVLADGALLLGGGMYFSNASGMPSGLVRPESHYLLVGPDGTMVGDLGNVPTMEAFSRVSGSGFSMSGIPFGRLTVIAGSSDRVWLGTGDSWELRSFTPNAELERIVRFNRSLQRVTPSLVDAYVDERVADAADETEARTRRAELADVPTSEVVPPYQVLRTDVLDDIWIGEFVLPGESTETWTIIDTTGRAIGRVTTPRGALPLYIASDRLLAVTRDELDVESLTLWRLRRPRTETR